MTNAEKAAASAVLRVIDAAPEQRVTLRHLRQQLASTGFADLAAQGGLAVLTRPDLAYVRWVTAMRSYELTDAGAEFIDGGGRW